MKCKYLLTIHKENTCESLEAKQKRASEMIVIWQQTFSRHAVLSPKKMKNNREENEEQMQNIRKDTEKVESINGKGRCGTMKGIFEIKKMMRKR